MKKKNAPSQSPFFSDAVEDSVLQSTWEKVNAGVEISEYTDDELHLLRNLEEGYFQGNTSRERVEEQNKIDLDSAYKVVNSNTAVLSVSLLSGLCLPALTITACVATGSPLAAAFLVATSCIASYVGVMKTWKYVLGNPITVAERLGLTQTERDDLERGKQEGKEKEREWDKKHEVIYKKSADVLKNLASEQDAIRAKVTPSDETISDKLINNAIKNPDNRKTLQNAIRHNLEYDVKLSMDIDNGEQVEKIESTIITNARTFLDQFNAFVLSDRDHEREKEEFIPETRLAWDAFYLETIKILETSSKKPPEMTASEKETAIQLMEGINREMYTLTASDLEKEFDEVELEVKSREKKDNAKEKVESRPRSNSCTARLEENKSNEKVDSSNRQRSSSFVERLGEGTVNNEKADNSRARSNSFAECEDKKPSKNNGKKGFDWNMSL